MMHHYTKFACKRFRTSGGYFLRIWSHTVTLTLKIGTLTFRMTLQVDDAPTYQVSLRNVEWFWRYYPDKYSLRTRIKFCHKTLWHVMVYHYTTFGCKRFTSSGDMEVSYFFENLTPHCDLDLEDRNPTFCMTLRVMMMNKPYQVSWIKVKWLRSYRPDKYYLRIWTISVTLTAAI